MNAKLLIIILGGLIVLFFVGTGWGVLSDDQSVGGTAEAVVNVVRGLQAKEPLSPDEVINATPANCREQLRQKQFTLAGGQSCRLDVRESSAPVRTLMLRLEDGNRVRLHLRAGGEDGREHTEILPLEGEEDDRTDDERRELELQFVSEGGRLTITCERGAGADNQCVLDVLSS